ncbi:hypothetical protein KP509_06G069700 [Ceratopteris richardii]|uniref:NAC domain-containing protein n=1 Tax=Ceratopteris richardii TaxID=49495 RepID=A0A8T2UNV6_CERRI|nr:hypothetical protein KP509_06G069700 [Ceratopteris richardii]
MATTAHTHVPPGFRFHPTDEELINFYLKKKVAMDEFDLDHVICEVDLNKLEPWDLQEKCKIDASHQTEWYFFSHKDKKYPTGTRTNRATAAGFWKATGRDKAVHSAYEHIGMRKTLVFYRGRAPHGKKTDWIMHEYRLEDKDDELKSNEDGWVVCRVFKKRNQFERNMSNDHTNLSDEELSDPTTKQTKRHRKRKQEKDQPTPATRPCKEEDLDENITVQSSFLQLPQLESPKTTISTDFKSVFAENCKHNTDKQSSFSTDDGSVNEQEECSAKGFFMSEDNLTEFIYSGSLTDNWSVYDNIARYHLDCFSIPTDFSQSLQMGRPLHPSEYQSTCEIDLWNFSR